MEDKNIFVPLGGERERGWGGEECVQTKKKKKTGCESFFFPFSSPWMGFSVHKRNCNTVWSGKKNKQKLPRRNVTKRCDSRADVSLSRRPAAKSKISPLLISAALPSLPP